jgi:hypothetical protein
MTGSDRVCTAGATALRDHSPELLVEAPGGLTSTPCPSYGLIPLVALDSLAGRFAFGEQTRRAAGKQAWNALTPQDGLTREFVRIRLEHVIKHAMLAIAKLEGSTPRDGDDDAGGIMFGGAALAQYNWINKL